MNLTSTDCLITLVYFALMLAVANRARNRVKTGADFFQASRSLPAWVCGLAFFAAGMGAPEVIGMGAAGARFGLVAARSFILGAVPAMLFLAVFMAPIYYGSKARTVPEYLGLRFDSKTRTLNAILFVAMSVFSAGVSMTLFGRVFNALHVFDGIFRAMGWPLGGIFVLSVALPAVIVLSVVLLGGLRGAIYGQVVQFLVLGSGLLPVVLLGLKKIGGWNGLVAALPAAGLQSWHGAAHGGSIVLAGLGLGLLVCGSFWCADFRVLQMAMAAKNLDSARRAPLVAALAAMLLPLLLVVPGMVSIALPTPRTSTFTRFENGAIIHETTMARPEAELGNGLVPARMDTATGQPVRDASGRVALDYAMATPNLLPHVLPNGLLGLGLTALLASLMSGLAANVTALGAVLTRDLYEPFMGKALDDGQALRVGRWAAAGAFLLAAAAACAATRLDNLLGALLLVFSVAGVPIFAAVLMGMFWKRATGHGAFAGLAAGASAALLHHGLTLPADAYRGMSGGWIAVARSYPDDLTQCFWTALLAFCVSLLVTVAVSLVTKARPEAEQAGLVRSLTPWAGAKRMAWWKRPETLAVGILLVAIATIFLG